MPTNLVRVRVRVHGLCLASDAEGFWLPVLKAFVGVNFQVTVLTRFKKAETYDASVEVVEVDFTSVESLTTALEGIDGLVSTVAAVAIENQTVLIEAAVTAGMKRVVPSECGNCTTSPKLESLPVYDHMFKIRQYLQKNARTGKLAWTVLACGAFLDFLFDGPMISATSLPNIGKAITGIFKNFEAAKNKIVRASEAVLTQNKVLAIAKEVRPYIKWEVSTVQASAVLKEGLDVFSAGDFSIPVTMKILTGTAFAGDIYGGAYDETDNELLSVKELTEGDLNDLVAGKLA
ncbi:hypothetical protein BJX99DRAFT_256622 [Aspergillus californicus]